MLRRSFSSVRREYHRRRGATYNPSSSVNTVTPSPSQMAGFSTARVLMPLARQAIISLSWLNRPYTMVAANSAAMGSVRETITGMLYPNSLSAWRLLNPRSRSGSMTAMTVITSVRATVATPAALARSLAR